MKKLCLIVSCLLWFAAKASAVVVGPFPGLDKMIERSDLVVVVRVERVENQMMSDHWGVYGSRVIRVLKGQAPEKGYAKLQMCGAITDWPYSFATGTEYIVFMNKTSINGAEYLAPAIYGAVMRASPFSQEPKGDTVQEKVAHVIREGRDFCKALHDSEQRTFRTMLGEPPALPVPVPAAPAPKR
jgi:hypothetical protein